MVWVAEVVAVRLFAHWMSTRPPLPFNSSWTSGQAESVSRSNSLETARREESDRHAEKIHREESDRHAEDHRQRRRVYRLQ